MFWDGTLGEAIARAEQSKQRLAEAAQLVQGGSQAARQYNEHPRLIMVTEDVKATIREGSHALDESRKTIEKTGADLTDASALALATLHDSSNDLADKTRHGLPRLSAGSS
jgi:hypothetical protein